MTIAYQLELMLNTLLHIHSKWFVESLIKRLQMIVCPLLMKTKLPVSLVRIIAIAYHKHFLMQLVCGQQPNVSHF